jgi:hypothetical protein
LIGVCTRTNRRRSHATVTATPATESVRVHLLRMSSPFEGRRNGACQTGDAVRIRSRSASSLRN